MSIYKSKPLFDDPELQTYMNETLGDLLQYFDYIEGATPNYQFKYDSTNASNSVDVPIAHFD